MPKSLYSFVMVLILLSLLLTSVLACSQTPAPGATPASPSKSAGAPTASSPAASASQTVNWRFNTTVPAEHYHYLALKWMADEVAKQTNGNFKITIFPQGSLPFTQDQGLFDVEKGNVEGAHMLGASVAGTEPAMDMLSLPGVYPADLNTKRQIADYIYPDYKKVIEAKHSVILYSIMLQSARNLYSKKPVKTLTDIKGLKIRSAGGMEADFTNKLSATAVSLNANELYQALQTGTIDGYWLVDTGTKQWKLNEVVKNIANISSGESGNFVCINKTEFDKLPAAYQKILLDIQPAYQKKVGDGMIEQMSGARKELLTAGMAEYNWTPEDLKPLQALYKPYADAWVAKVPPDAKALFEKTTAYIDKGGK